MNNDYASFGYLDDQPAAFARFPLAPQAGACRPCQPFDAGCAADSECCSTTCVDGGPTLGGFCE